MVFIQPEYTADRLPLFDLNLNTRVLELKMQLVHHWCWLRNFIYHLEYNECVLSERGQLGHYGVEDQSVIDLKIHLPYSKPPPPAEYHMVDDEVQLKGLLISITTSACKLYRLDTLNSIAYVHLFM